MRLCYFDEAGDDGWPKVNSPLFVLTGVVVAEDDWQAAFDRYRDLRKRLRDVHRLPLSAELHTRELLRGAGPFSTYRRSDRLAIMHEVAHAIGGMPLRAVTVAIVKPRLRHPTFQVLDTCVTWILQRIANNSPDRFVMITDRGRIGPMRAVARRVQRTNFVPSHFDESARQMPIGHLIEDAFEADSKNSPFVQVADFIATTSYYFVLKATKAAPITRRVRTVMDYQANQALLRRMKPALMTEASNHAPHGIIVHPRVDKNEREAP